MSQQPPFPDPEQDHTRAAGRGRADGPSSPPPQTPPPYQHFGAPSRTPYATVPGPTPGPTRVSGSGRRTAAIAGMVGTAGLILLVASIASAMMWTRGGVEPVAGPVSNTSSATPTPTPTPTLTPTTTPTPTTAPTPTPTPTRSAKPERIRAKDYGGDFKTQYGNTKLRAKIDDWWNHDTCVPIEKDGRLTSQGCKYAVEWTYKARDDRLQMTRAMLEFKKAKQAKKAANNMSEADFAMRTATFLPEWSFGKWRAQAVGNKVLLTWVTAYSSVPDKIADEYLTYSTFDMYTDLLLAG